MAHPNPTATAARMLKSAHDCALRGEWGQAAIHLGGLHKVCPAEFRAFAAPVVASVHVHAAAERFGVTHFLLTVVALPADATVAWLSDLAVQVGQLAEPPAGPMAAALEAVMGRPA